jgi:hypothetical protein
MKKFILCLSVVIFLLSCGESGAQRKKGGTHAVVEDTAKDTTKKVVSTPKVKPVVNVYMENSYSMHGYVNGQTDFKASVWNYLANIKISGIADALNLNYINTIIIPHQKDIDDFIKHLDPTSMKDRGGDKGLTDLAEIFKTLLKESNDNTVSMLVSDFIFSPGKGKDAGTYITGQTIGIKVAIADYLKKHPNTGILIYRLTSEFDGIYYNREDAHTKINARRPFYIFLFGHVDHLAQLRKTIPDRDFKGSGIKQSYTLLPTSINLDYSILTTPKYGSFKRDHKNPSKSINGMKRASKGVHDGKFMFSIGTDFKKLTTLLSSDYVLNASNYKIIRDKQDNGDFNLEIEENKNSENKYSHNLKLTSDPSKNIPSGNFEISLCNVVPKWVEDFNDTTGLNINAEGAMNKTYGIKSIIDGIYEAYQILGYGNYTTVEVTLIK